LWLDPACVPSDKIVLEKYMSKVSMQACYAICLLLTEGAQVAPKLDRIGQGKELLDLCKVLIPIENSPWLNA
jgi:hypothetical protein